MKKLLSCLLFLFLHTQYLISHDINQPPTILQKQLIASHIKKPTTISHEGFLKNSLVLTPSGYQKIQDLQIGDIIYNNHDQNCEKIIINTVQKIAPQFIQLIINDEIVNAAYNQKFYVPEKEAWIQACDLTISDQLLSRGNQLVYCDSINIIDQQVILYCITVQDHLFTISSQDIMVHNSAAAIAIPSILFNYIHLVQPVIALLGTTTSLYYSSSYAPPIEQGQTIMYQASPEKIYFDSRYQELQKLNQNCASVHATLKTIKCQFQDQYGLLTYQRLFNNSFANSINVSAEYEAQLDFEQRFQLTEIRKKILENLEEDICSIQISIGLFANEILHRKHATVQYYNDFIARNPDSIHECFRLPNNISYPAIMQYYTFTAICNMLLEEIENRNNECLIANQCFATNNEIVNKTTNITQVFNQEKQNIASSKTTIDKTKIGNEVKLQNVIVYFKKHPPFQNINQQIINVKNDLYQSFQNNKQNQKNKIRYEQIPTKNPKKPDDDDDDNPKTYEKSAKHPDYKTIDQAEQYLAKGISPSPQDGQQTLDKSIKLKDGAWATTQNGYIVIFYRTRRLPEGGSVYHGFIITYQDMIKKPHYVQSIKILKSSNLITSTGKL